MSYRVHIQDLWMKDQLGIHIGTKSAGTWGVVQPTDLVFHPEEPAVETPPAIEIPYELARVLYEALAVHFHGDALTVDMRKALDIERARLDKFIDQATSVTHLSPLIQSTDRPWLDDDGNVRMP